MPKPYSATIEPLLKLRSLNAAIYDRLLLSTAPSKDVINLWYTRQRDLIHEAAAEHGYAPADFEKLTIVRDDDVPVVVPHLRGISDQQARKPM